MAYDNILLERRGEGIALLTLNQPEKRNALSTGMQADLMAAIQEVKEDASLRVMVVTGAGPVFCAGADLNAMRSKSTLELREYLSLFPTMAASMNHMGKPTIAAVNGLALAGGAGITVTCDLAISSDQARFGVTETNVGLWPMTIQATMYRSLGRKRLLHMLMTGDTMDAWEAERIGLINQVVPHDKLEEAWMELATKLARKSPPSMKIGKDSYYAMEDMEWSQSQAYLRECLVTLLNTEDAQEGLNAFMEKRKPQWKGR
ncbi:MAG: enoyl-CoA hydratase-related protein [Dehalococcoidia bacterium]|nr:enoyl-CoA hydratase-related protein [Dehalococcoidia bacterium]